MHAEGGTPGDREPNDVVARSTTDVITCVGIDEVAARAAVHQVMAPAAVETIWTAPADDAVGAGGSRQAVLTGIPTQGHGVRGTGHDHNKHRGERYCATHSRDLSSISPELAGISSTAIRWRDGARI